MEKSKDELLTGMKSLVRGEEFPEELFTSIMDATDAIERQRYIDAARNEAKSLGRVSEFNRLLKLYIDDYRNKSRESDHKTEFTDQPMTLKCGEWIADDLGVRAMRFDRLGNPIKAQACSHPLLPIEILENVDTTRQRITLAYFKDGDWRHLTVDRAVCANANKIVDALSQYGIEVTSDNAKNLVRYISDCVGLNPKVFQAVQSVGRLGWFGKDFIPYEENIRYEGDPEYEPIFRNIAASGSLEEWIQCVGELRKKSLPLRLMIDASISSVLLDPLGLLAYVYHAWGGTGLGKTVALMVAMSVWGVPKLGGLVKTMNMTKNAIMRNAAFLCSIPFAGDELQTIKDRWVGNFDQLVYQVTEGVDRGRARASGGVEETRTWKNVFIFTGEEPITKSNSGGGMKNRVIEVAVDGPLVEDGHAVVEFISKNYGHAGRELVKYIQTCDISELIAQYREISAEICKLDTTDKQAMAGGSILMGDILAGRLFFKDETPLTVKDIAPYLHSAKEVDVAARAYQEVVNWAARNPARFKEPGNNNLGECWGKIENDKLIVNRSVLADFMQSKGFDLTAALRKWSADRLIEKNSQGKFACQTRVFGIKAAYVTLKLPEDEKNIKDDSSQFVEVCTQQTLPFD